MYKKLFVPIVWAAGVALLAMSCSSGKAGDATFRTVRFETNGGSEVGPQVLPDGAIVAKPEDPEREKSKFADWYTDAALAGVYDFNAQVRNDITLYAKWLSVFTVTFETNGGSTVSPQEVADTEKVTRPKNPTKDGEGFVNWYTESALTNKYDFETPVTNNLTLYAKWSHITYTVTFDANGGTFAATGSETDVETVGENGTVSRPVDPVRPGGWNLENWYTGKDLATVYDFNTPITTDRTLYAKWEVTPVPVEFWDATTLLYEADALWEENEDGAIVYIVPAYRHPGTESSIPSKGNNFYFRHWEDISGTIYIAGDVIPKPVPALLFLSAQWLDLNAGKELLADLEAKLNEINELINGSTSADLEYEDEYVIGDGALVGADITTEQQIFMVQVNAILATANELKQGTEKTEMVKVLEEDTEVLRPVTYREYDYAGIEAIIVELQNLMEDPLFDPGSFAPQQVLITQSGSVHSVTVTKSGIYEIEVWGASGGHMWPTGTVLAPVLGGRGGHAKGQIELAAGDVLKVRIGGAGTGSASYNSDDNSFAKIPAGYAGAKAGGYNGGGNGGASLVVNNGAPGGSGGGGATDVRLLAMPYNKGVNDHTNGTNDDGVTGLDTWETRIIVAAGGGGAAHAANLRPGLAGGDAEHDGRSSHTIVARAGGTEPQDPIENISTGNILGKGGNGRKGASGGSAKYEGTGGGGGGCYGGEAIIAAGITASGAGGGNYIADTFVNDPATKITGLNPVFGSGKAFIKWVGDAPN